MDNKSVEAMMRKALENLSPEEKKRLLYADEDTEGDSGTEGNMGDTEQKETEAPKDAEAPKAIESSKEDNKAMKEQESDTSRRQEKQDAADEKGYKKTVYPLLMKLKPIIIELCPDE